MTQVQTIQPQGLLDGDKGLDLQASIQAALADGAQVLLVDCQDITFMDSSGLGAMVIALKLARGENCHFCLCSLNDNLDMLFTLTDTHQVFDIYPNRAAFEAKWGRSS